MAMPTLKKKNEDNMKVFLLTYIFYLLLSIGMAYYQEGCNIDSFAYVFMLKIY
jgi:hypothetical protein